MVRESISKGPEARKKEERRHTVPSVEANDGDTQQRPSTIRAAPHLEEDGFLVLLDLLAGRPPDFVQFGLEFGLVDVLVAELAERLLGLGVFAAYHEPARRF